MTPEQHKFKLLTERVQELEREIGDNYRQHDKSTTKHKQEIESLTLGVMKLRTDQEYKLKSYMISRGIVDLSLGLQTYFDDVGTERFRNKNPRPVTLKKITPGMCTVPGRKKPI